MTAIKVTAYGRSGGLTAESFCTERGFHTVTLDLARPLNASPGPGMFYDWKEKIQVQLIKSELPLFLCVVLGWLPNCEGLHHGQQHDKGFKLTHQGTHVYLEAFAAGKGKRTVRLDGVNLLDLSGLLIAQLLKNSPWLTADSLLAMIRNTLIRTQQPTLAPPQSDARRTAP